jgi:segregation and condensation protein A
MNDGAAPETEKQAKKREAAESLSPYSISVGAVYDGPLDLLLDLIRKQDIDIYDIPIGKITAQFLAYVEGLKQAEVDAAADFIYVASLLIHIKSRMLLPRTSAEGVEGEQEDPRRELVERLLEHERFKNAAQMLLQKQQIEAATWTNPAIRQFNTEEGTEPEIAADTVDLVRVFREILDRARQRPVLNVDEEAVTVSQMLDYIRRRLIMEERPVSLSSLLRNTHTERALICMFLALLELVRLQAILLRQDRNFGEVYIKKHASFESIVNQGLQTKDDWR